MNFEILKNKWSWHPIRNCPGRFVLKSDAELSLEDLFGVEVKAREFSSVKAKDRIIVVKLEGGGLISYKRDDGSCLHTLNTEEGFERKLLQLEIELNEKSL